MLQRSFLRSGAFFPLRLLSVLGLIVSLLQFSVLPAYAAGGQNGNLSGVVVDATSKAGVAGARITIASPSGRFTATTDSGGRFTINGANVDSYTLSVEASGYEAFSLPGITIQGDQTATLGSISISKSLRTIGRTQVRSASGAYQPNQTIDSYTVSGARATQALGKQANTNETQLLLSVPGVSQTNSGDVTIRGGLQNEIGYQLNGVPFTEPFLSHNASNGRINGLSSAQVVEGAGDATQGNIGSGLINVVPKRGTYPGAGLADFEFGGPSFDHQIGFEYGLATRSGNISNYFSYTGERFAPYQGYFNQNAAFLGQDNARTANQGLIGYFGSSLESNDDLLDNFVFKFGKGNRQSLEVLYNTRDLQEFGEAGGLTGRQSYLYDPYTQNVGGNPFPGDPATAAALYAAYTPVVPYASTSAQQLQNTQIVSASPTKLFNVQYDNNLDDKTYFVLRYYNFFGQNITQNLFDSSTDPLSSITGGQRTGGNFELTHTLGQHTLTLQAQLENQHPQWNNYDAGNSLSILQFGVDANAASPNGLSVNDFLPAVNNSGVNGWVYQHLGQTRIPTVGINYNQADFQTSGIGLRDQWALNSRIKFDYGVRVDHANYKYGANPYNPDLSNPSDVPPSFITNDVLHPTVVDPRFAVSVQPSSRDAFRFSYGRSVEFLNAQNAGTPAGLYGAEALMHVPVLPGTNTANPATWDCGSGLNPVHAVASKANVAASGGSFFRCSNYAQQLYWAYDQNFDAPDLGNGTSPQYSNLDLSYSHQFRNGFGAKLTGFYRRSTGEPGFFVLSQAVDPATGSVLYEVFSVNNNAIIKTPGIEAELTTPERPYGFSGYLSATYQNSLSSVPPLVRSEDTLPLVTAQSFALGNLYRAGFISPLVFNVGGSFKTKGGLRISPQVQFNAGYPTGVGSLVAYNGLINGLPYNVPQTNLGGAQPTILGFNNTNGASAATQYVDPAYPGSILKPNIAATRGEKETSSAGGELTNPSFTANLTVEYAIAKRHTLGIQINNLFGNIYSGSVPIPNTYYQPVTTGIAGPATGKPLQANPAQTLYANHGYVNIPNSSYGQNAFLLLPNTPTTYRLYYQVGL